MSGTSALSRNPPDHTPRSLSARERDVAGRAARGLSNKVIADELGISLGSVAMYLARAIAKLGLGSRMDLITLSSSGAPAAADAHAGHGLTQVERAVMAALLHGLSREAIAATRGRARATVNRQIESIYRKLGVGSRAELACRVGGARVVG